MMTRNRAVAAAIVVVAVILVWRGSGARTGARRGDARAGSPPFVRAQEPVGWVFGRLIGVHSTAMPGPAPAGSVQSVGGRVRHDSGRGVAR